MSEPTQKLAPDAPRPGSSSGSEMMEDRSAQQDRGVVLDLISDAQARDRLLDEPEPDE